VAFDFGGKNFWLDKVDALSQAEICLEIRADDLGVKAEHFKKEGIIRRDEIEELPEDFEGFWITNPERIIKSRNDRVRFCL
jgi:hypothetical protein